MANGATARMMFPEPSVIPVQQAKPDTIPTRTETAIGEATAFAAKASDMAIEIGNLVADLAACLGQALIDHESTGAMAITTKWQAGDLFARLYALQEATTGELDFAATMRIQGKIALARRFSAGVRLKVCPDLDSTVLDAVHGEAIGWIGNILMKVTCDERGRAN